jgi:hypothetical protein
VFRLTGLKKQLEHGIVFSCVQCTWRIKTSKNRRKGAGGVIHIQVPGSVTSNPPLAACILARAFCLLTLKKKKSNTQRKLKQEQEQETNSKNPIPLRHKCDDIPVSITAGTGQRSALSWPVRASRDIWQSLKS